MAQVHRTPEAWIDIEIYRGATFSLRFTYRERETQDIIPLDGADVYMQVRDDAGDLLHEATTANGEISTDVDGRVEITIPPDETSGFTWGRGTYDIFVVRPGGTFTDVVARGCAVVTPNITEVP